MGNGHLQGTTLPDNPMTLSTASLQYEVSCCECEGVLVGVWECLGVGVGVRASWCGCSAGKTLNLERIACV